MDLCHLQQGALRGGGSYNHKHNLANGEHNRDGHHANFSTNCGVEGPSSDPAVLALVEKAIKACLAQGKYIGICGQGPSDHPDFAQWLEEQGISSISLNPDSVVATWQQLASK